LQPLIGRSAGIGGMSGYSPINCFNENFNQFALSNCAVLFGLILIYWFHDGGTTICQYASAAA
jgi:hypothetical protein